jgi:exopolyphosphatase/guanosine-5'-triphosphate,3'-diphosphate pyrophosphatase
MTTEVSGSLRWEWRTFAERFDAVDAVLSSETIEREADSEELYVLSKHSDASVKVRKGLLDVKRLERVDDDGLELWRPLPKLPFPLPVDDVRSLLTVLAVDVPALRRSSYSLDELEHDVVAPDPSLRTLSVRKQRRHYRIDGCMVEVTSLVADGAPIRTVVVEHEDPALVVRTLGRLRLEGRRNVSVARGLKTLCDFGARRHAVVDVGTNSVKLHVGEIRPDGEIRAVLDRADISRLGEGLTEHGALTDAAIHRTVEAVSTLLDEARRAGAAEIGVVGTAGLRMASNRDAFDDALRAKCGVSIDVITGDDEGRLAYLAATTALPATHGRVAVFDTGGGSSQFTFGRAGHVDERFSVNVGAVRIAERYELDGSVTEDHLAHVMDALAGELHALGDRAAPDALIGMGGTVTNLAAVQHGLATYDADVVHGTVLSLGEIDRQIDLYRTRDVAKRREIVGLQPQRADVILAGACIVRSFLSLLRQAEVTVSDRGLRHGLFLERFGRRRD